MSTPRPIILDLDGNGIRITDLSQSTIFIDGGDGLEHRTAWAGAGDAVLFYDPDNTGEITEMRQYVFTEWDPTAASDMEALASVFDTNGDGELSGAELDDFRLMVTNDDGTTTSHTLAQLGITSINLRADTTHIELPDGSMITGQSTFMRANGTTGTVANTTLVSDSQGYRLERVESVDGSGNIVVEQTGFDADGEVAFIMESVTSPDGSLVTNSYDVDGDGVVDQIQTIATVTNVGVDTVETVRNMIGAVAATALLLNETETTTSWDGGAVSIARDSTGGGWVDQTEVRTTLTGGVRSTVIADLAENGDVITSSSEVMSSDGLNRTVGYNLDGIGGVDRTDSHVITVHGDGSRTELIEVRNGDGSLRSSVTELISADGRDKTIERDLDGDGDIDTREETLIVVDANGSTSSTIEVYNQDDSLRNSVTQDHSDDALLRTTVTDADGDGDIEFTTVDETVIDAFGRHTQTVTVTNADGSIRSAQEVVLEADQVTSQTSVDLNQDGALSANEVVRSVVVDPLAQERIATEWARNADGSVNSSTVSTTSQDGLTQDTAVDANGDGGVDTAVHDVTVVNGAGVSTRTIETRNQDGSLRNKSLIVTSADGLTTTTWVDRDGDGSFDAKTVDVRVLNGNGSITRTVSEYAGNGTTLLAETITDQSADRLTTTVSTDANGDGVVDLVVSSVEAADGTTVVTSTTYLVDGEVSGVSIDTISANGLVSTITTDADGNSSNESIVANSTTYNADGSRTITQDVNNGDGSDRSDVEAIISDDGLTTTVQTDANGDGVFERVVSQESTLNANGSVTQLDQVHSSDGTLLNQTRTIVSDDGLLTTTASDADGDGDFDLTSQTTTVFEDDGDTIVSTELRDQAGSLRSGSSVISTDNGRSIITVSDVNGDGFDDATSTRVVSDDGTLTATQSNLNANGSLQNRAQTITSSNGLTTTVLRDRDGNGIYETEIESATVLGTDGSVTRVVESVSADGTIHSQSTEVTSDDGLVTTSSVDLNNDGAVDLTTTSTLSHAANGVETFTVENRAADNSVLDNSTRVTSADQRTVTEAIDADANGFDDSVRTIIVDDEGVTTTTSNYYSTGGTLQATYISTLSGDGLTLTHSTDRNGDGEVELFTTVMTSLGDDGTTSRSVEHRNDRFIDLAHEEYFTSDDGLFASSSLDLDGDGLFELATEYETVFQADGSVINTQSTRDNLSALLSNIIATTSGNGLVTSVVADYNGDASVDRTRVVSSADISFLLVPPLTPDFTKTSCARTASL